MGFVLVGLGAPTRAGVRPLEGPTVSTPVIERSTTTEPLLRLGAKRLIHAPVVQAGSRPIRPRLTSAIRSQRAAAVVLRPVAWDRRAEHKKSAPSGALEPSR